MRSHGLGHIIGTLYPDIPRGLPANDTAHAEEADNGGRGKEEKKRSNNLWRESVRPENAARIGSVGWKTS